ncbi:acyl-CoA thioesterase [Pestalotiopsis sp. IQ-011]
MSGWKCHGGQSQIWRIHEVGMHGPWHKYMMQKHGISKYVPVHTAAESANSLTESTAFMDLAWGKNEWGTEIWGWNGDTAAGAANDHQLWHFESADPYDRNIVWIKKTRTKLVVELVGASVENGTRIEGYFLRPIEENRKEQMWKITVVG